MNTPQTSLQSAQPSPVTTRPYSKWFEPHPGLGISLMDHLYNRLDGAYPHKWRANFPDAQAIDNWQESWVEAFEDEGITPDEVKAGLKACRSRYAWPPSCAEFIQACKPYADPVASYHEAVAGLEARRKGEMGTWSHPAIYWAATFLQNELMGQSYSALKDRWAAVLKGQLSRTNWAEIPQPRRQLPAPGKTMISREAAAAMIRQLEEQGIVVRAVSARPVAAVDDKRWARRILKRVADGDKSVTITTANMAREALGLASPEEAEP